MINQNKLITGKVPRDYCIMSPLVMNLLHVVLYHEDITLHIWIRKKPAIGIHMANIHQDGHSIRNMQMVSNKFRIFKPFFVYQIKGASCFLSKTKLKKINLGVRFLPLKIAF